MRGKVPLLAACYSLAAVASLLGAVALIDFDSSPGLPAQPPLRWPVQSGITRAKGTAQLLVFAHPRCSCTPATFQELRTLTGARVTVRFFRPDSGSDWAPGSSWKMAELLGAEIAWDDGGREAKRFGSATSGTVLLYSAAGDLLFNGGVTAARGHVGENLGFARLQAALRTGRSSVSRPPVFGCGLDSLFHPGKVS